MNSSHAVEFCGFSIQMFNTEDKNKILQDIAEDTSSRQDEDDPFMVTDLGDIVDKHIRWERNLPRVKPFYAVKCNGDPVILRLLAELGTGFDCASQKEIEDILSIGVSPDRIVYANPCKQKSHVKYASENGVNLTVVDNVGELYKMKSTFPQSRLLIRISPVDGSKSLMRLDNKYGCSTKEACVLIDKAVELDLNLVGISFHVGSNCIDASSYVETLEQAKYLFDRGAENGFTFNILDIGGGFPGNKDYVIFDKLCKIVTEALDKYFPQDGGVKIIAEPGRYFVASASTLVVNVIAKSVKPFCEECTKCEKCTNEITKNAQHMSYFVNEGVFGACNLLPCEKVKLRIYPLSKRNHIKEFKSTVWGQTTSEVDCLGKETQLPELNIGEWMVIDLDMGAYTQALYTNFNGMPLPHNYYTISPQHLFIVKPFPPADYLRG